MQNLSDILLLFCTPKWPSKTQSAKLYRQPKWTLWRHIKTKNSQTLNWRVPTQTTIHKQLHRCYENGTNTRRPQASILTSNHFSPAYHFHFPLIVLRPPSTNHPTNHHYPQPTLRAYWTFVWPQPTFSTAVNTTSNHTKQLWAPLFPLLWLK